MTLERAVAFALVGGLIVASPLVLGLDLPASVFTSPTFPAVTRTPFNSRNQQATSVNKAISAKPSNALVEEKSYSSAKSEKEKEAQPTDVGLSRGASSPSASPSSTLGSTWEAQAGKEMSQPEVITEVSLSEENEGSGTGNENSQASEVSSMASNDTVLQVSVAGEGKASSGSSEIDEVCTLPETYQVAKKKSSPKKTSSSKSKKSTTKAEIVKQTLTRPTPSAYIEEIRKIMRSVALGTVPTGFSLSRESISDAPQCRQEGLAFNFAAGQMLKGRDFNVFIGLAKNHTESEIEFKGRNCASNRTVAVSSWPETVISAGEETEIYVIVRNKPLAKANYSIPLRHSLLKPNHGGK
ncbi:MAG: type-F conjugative transfer system secretin TraK [Burkholderiales bacterium]|nr:type-F conjugative transfer system secretin TraK [Burkholderiales bacterium]